jgi:fatty acid desaturase
MDTTTENLRPGEPANGGIGDLLRGIADDVKALARDEASLVKLELSRSAKRAAGDAAAVLLAGLVALIGLGMLCTAAVVALEPVMPSLTARLLLMALVYLAAGGVVAAVFARRLKHDASPDLTRSRHEARRTVSTVKAVRHV